MGAGLRGFRAEVAEFDPARKLEQARTLEQRVGEQVGQRFPGWRVSTEAVEDPPAAEVIRKAREWGADLIVAGSRGLFWVEHPLRRIGEAVTNIAFCFDYCV
jgi:nucleotide-binding universal stress UspA family protein